MKSSFYNHSVDSEALKWPKKQEIFFPWIRCGCLRKASGELLRKFFRSLICLKDFHRFWDDYCAYKSFIGPKLGIDSFCDVKTAEIFHREIIRRSYVSGQTFSVVTEYSQQFCCIIFCKCTFNAHVSQITSCLNSSSRNRIDTLICYWVGDSFQTQTSILINLSFVSCLPMWNRSCFFVIIDHSLLSIN